MLGGNPRQSVVGRGCTYDVPGGSMRLVIRPEPFDKNGPREVEDRYKTGDGETENAELRRTGGLKGAAAAGLTGPGFFLKTIRKPAMKAEGLSIQDEPSFEKGSFSARKREAIDLQLAVKSFVLVVGVRDESKEIPAAMLDKLRDIAKKAASRL